jgi:hypothetical protein
MRPLAIEASVAFAAAFVLCGSAVRAHEIGTTRVSVLLQTDRTYDIEIVTDAAALAEKLEVSAGRPATPAAFADIFRRRLKVAFDGNEVQPTIGYVVSEPDPARSSRATIRLRGDIPRDAREFTWTYSWTFTSYSLTIRAAGAGPMVTEWLEGGETSTPFALALTAPSSGGLAAAWRYFALGFTHIVPHGLDHVLFVIGIFLLTGRGRAVLWQVSAFTIAHSITLGLSMYNVVAVSPALVEPLIALSIAYVAIENIFLSELKSWRVVLVFAFGLLHGMGFAGALKELALRPSEFLQALLAFNIGVEAGQLAVIGAAFGLVGLHFGSRDWYRRRVVVPASLLIACTAIYWTVQRITV